ncbi:hypothetical protein OHC33_004628 [Knufia fluminis]|uniref:Uncharacterized protein n=1 Tax=Knufia fluminis TaxID=191047 RepID=A0AAN8EM80_9EURO|nr:hypothetical protein OHC33_004628 [Knufia fluminis]
MHPTSYLALASALTLATAQTPSVTRIFLPLAADDQILVASVIDQNPDAKTLAITCPPDIDSNDCGFPEPITVTVGPSTYHQSPTGYYEAYGEFDCKITGTTEAACAATVGAYEEGDIDSEGSITGTAVSSRSTSTVVTGTDLLFVDVTITAGAVAEETGSTSASGTGIVSQGGSGSTSGFASVTASGSATQSESAGSSSSSASSAAAATASGNVAAGVLEVGVAGLVAGMMGLPMLLL